MPTAESQKRIKEKALHKTFLYLDLSINVTCKEKMSFQTKAQLSCYSL